MRTLFDEQLDKLNVELIKMGALCEEAISLAMKALLDGNLSFAEKAIETDSRIDRSERDIESLCLKLLLQQQPVARDLRIISSALKMISDMERIGDQASDISEICEFIDLKTAKEFPVKHIEKMSVAAISMVTESIDSFVRKDAELANKVIADDDTVDDLFNKIKADLISAVAHDSEKGEYYLDILMVAKYLERIGDHATNIAEWVLFSITGKHV